MRTTVMTAAMALALAGCGGGSEQEQEQATHDPAPAASAAANAGSGPPIAFVQCTTCHSLEPGKNGIGPSLAGIVGKKAAADASYAYSPALKSANLTWDEPTLDAWLTDPRALVPGNKMVYAGLRDPAKRKAVIEHLKTLK